MGQLFLGSRVPPWDLSAWESQGVELLGTSAPSPQGIYHGPCSCHMHWGQCEAGQSHCPHCPEPHLRGIPLASFRRVPSLVQLLTGDQRARQACS